MRILLVHRYYWPDAGAYAAMLHIMAKRFVAEGHKVTVYSTQPGYNNVYDGPKLPYRQVVDGVEIFRKQLFKEDKNNFVFRLMNFGLFAISLFFHCLGRFRKYELMTSATFPPIMMGFMLRWISWLSGCPKYLYHCQDISPEALAHSGNAKRPWLTRMAKSIDKRTCQKAAACVVLSEDMLKTLRRRGLEADNVHIINNFIIDELNTDVEIDPALEKQSGKFRVLFAGNMGRFQSLDKIVEAGFLLKDIPEIQIVFVGSGAFMDKLKELSAPLIGKSIEFHPFQPLESVLRIIHESDLSIISLTPGVIECAYPSKTMSYVEAGCRMLAILEPESELARLIESQDLGSVCGEPTAEHIRDAILTEFERWKKKSDDRDKIRAIGKKLFGQTMILDRWVELLRRLEN